MLELSLFVLVWALALGATAAVLSLASHGAPGPLPVALAHFVLALAGFALLILALGGPARGAANGTSSFGVLSATCFAVALVLGLALLRQRLKRRRLPGALVGVHASIAVAGFVVLMAYAMLT